MTEQEQINELRNKLEELEQRFNKNNFSTVQVFTKNIQANSEITSRSRISAGAGKLNVTIGLPADCIPGDIALNGNKIYACFSANVWTELAPYQPI